MIYRRKFINFLRNIELWNSDYNKLKIPFMIGMKRGINVKGKKMAKAFVLQRNGCILVFFNRQVFQIRNSQCFASLC